MAGTSSKTAPRTEARRRLTRYDREQASAAATSFDLGPLARGVAVIAGVVVLVLALSIAVPDPPRFGGPLQPTEGPTMVTVRKTGGEVVTIPVAVPWNTDMRSAVLERLTPVGADGLDLVKASVLPQGTDPLDPAPGLPADALEAVPLRGFTATPGLSALEGFQIAVSLKGSGAVSGFMLTYRVDGIVTSAFIPAGAMLCAARCEDRLAVTERQRDVAAELASFIDAPER